MRAFLATLALTAAFAQNAPQPVLIQGVVLDKVGRTPIAGASVVMTIVSRSTPAVVSGTADSGGRFALSIAGGAPFSVIVTAPGYERHLQQEPAPGQNGVFIEATLDRLAEIRGRVVDDETRKPIAGLGMTLVRPSLRQVGTASSIPAGLTTQDDGSFAFKNLTRGDYYLRIEGTPKVVIQAIPAQDLAGEAREKALQVPEPAEGYGIVLGPGDSAAEPKAPPVSLAAELLDLGDIRLRRYKLHNLSGVLGACEEGAYLQVLLLGRNGGGTVRLADLDTACGNGFRILNLSEGLCSL